MGCQSDCGSRRLSLNSQVLLLGLLLLAPLFPIIWLGWGWFNPETVIAFIMAAECLVSIGILFVKAVLRGRREEESEAAVIAASLRKAPGLLIKS
jgi:hypothetical protein